MTSNGGLIQNQNINVHLNGTSKANVVTKKKGGTGGRKPLGDLSNSVETSLNQASKRNDSKKISVIGEETLSKITSNLTKKKNIPKAPEKSQTGGGRKALSDISNSAKPLLPKASKKDEMKLSINAIAEEQFLHNHEECVNAKMAMMDREQFMKTVGLDNGFWKQVATPCPRPISSKSKSSMREFELEEMIEHASEVWCLSGKLETSPLACKTPKSPNHFIHWNDECNYINFRLMETP